MSDYPRSFRTIRYAYVRERFKCTACGRSLAPTTNGTRLCCRAARTAAMVHLIAERLFCFRIKYRRDEPFCKSATLKHSYKPGEPFCGWINRQVAAADGTQLTIAEWEHRYPRVADSMEKAMSRTPIPFGLVAATDRCERTVKVHSSSGRDFAAQHDLRYHGAHHDGGDE